MGKIKRLLVIFILAVICVLTPLEILIITGGMKGKPLRPADTAIILGCKVCGESPSVLLRRRIAAGINLYKRGFVKYIIASGGQGSGEKISEAECIKRYLIQRGIPGSLIYKDDKSINTMENLENSKKIMQDKNLRTAIVVTNPFHLYRSLKIAKDLKIDAQGAASGMQNIEFTCYIHSYSREAVSILKYYTLKSIDTITAICGTHDSGELSKDTSFNISYEDKEAESTIFKLGKLIEDKRTNEYIKLISSENLKFLNSKNDIINKIIAMNRYIKSFKINEIKFLNYIPQNNKKQEYEVKTDIKFNDVPADFSIVSMYLNKFRYITMIKEDENWKVDRISSSP